MSKSTDRADRVWMQRAIMLARRGVGLTRPNPPVGAVLVKGGRRVGEGWHRRAGGPHAEINALRSAGTRARGATLYITLEPCSTTGRTPPCTEAIVKAGVRRVVVAILDPNPAHQGRGLTQLRRHGIAATQGPCAPEAARLIEPFQSWITRRRPWITLKLGMTLDGRIADPAGRSKWITGDASRRAVQALRRAADAILIGAETLRADNPTLLPRPAAGRSPYRVIVSRSGRVPGRARVFTDADASRTILFVPESRRLAAQRCLGRSPSIVMGIPAGPDPAFLASVLRALGRLGVLHVLCEGGGILATNLLRAKLVDELYFFVAPKVLGAAARPAFGGVGWSLKQAPGFAIVDVRPSGADIEVVARRC